MVLEVVDLIVIAIVVVELIHDPHLREGGDLPSAVATEGRRQGAIWILTSRLMVASLDIGMTAVVVHGLVRRPDHRRRIVRGR